jgi:hypothetical protein
VRGSEINVTSATPNVNVSNDLNIVQIAPDRIGVIDRGTSTGIRGQLLIFDYDSGSKTFNFEGVLNYSEYLYHPEKYGIPKRGDN